MSFEATHATTEIHTRRIFLGGCDIHFQPCYWHKHTLLNFWDAVRWIFLGIWSFFFRVRTMWLERELALYFTRTWVLCQCWWWWFWFYCKQRIHTHWDAFLLFYCFLSSLHFKRIFDNKSDHFFDDDDDDNNDDAWECVCK